jgi:hypothetical protein
MSEDIAADVLNEALNIVTGARRKTYGTPEDNFRAIADLWTVYLRKIGADFTDPEIRLSPADIAALMALMKIARLAESPDHRDSWVDLAGYAACGARCALIGCSPAPSAPPAPANDGWQQFKTFDDFCKWARDKTFEARQHGDDTTSGPFMLFAFLSHENVWRSSPTTVWKWKESNSYREVQK